MLIGAIRGGWLGGTFPKVYRRREEDWGKILGEHVFKSYAQGEELFFPVSILPFFPFFLPFLIPSLDKYLLGPYSVPSTLVGTGDIPVKKIVPSLMQLVF